MRFQRVIQAIYPPQCVACDAATDADFGLCGKCWGETDFITGLVCHSCGTPLAGDDDGTPVQCDDCMTVARPWDQGRAVFAYAGVGRRIVLGLKHSDRTDYVPAVAHWMVQRIAKMHVLDPVLVPVPLHWTRLVKRRYNQSGLLAQAIAKETGHDVCVTALLRPKRTNLLDGHNREARFAALSDAITANPKSAGRIAARNILLVDDVMTSGATLAACTEALRAGGASNVSIVTLARVVKDA